MDNAELLEVYSKGLSSSGKTRTHYLKYAQDFLKYAEGKIDKETIEGYLKHLSGVHKYNDGTINFIFRVIRTMFSRNNIDWPYNRGDSPSIRESSITAPALHPELIKKMIRTVKDTGEPDEKAFLALSTTYGLRRVEMIGLKDIDIRLKDKTIHIATAKHGRERTHIIPEAILPYLKQYTFSNAMSEFALLGVWYRIEYRVGLKHTHRVGWHSIRRTLNTMLGKVVSQDSRKGFMRWKQRTSSDMGFRYSAQTFIGEEGETTEVVGEALTVDQEVFAVHPFLDAWS